jgi:hypothetical protein
MGYWGDPFTQPKRYRTNVEIHLLLERKAIDHLSKQSKALVPYCRGFKLHSGLQPFARALICEEWRPKGQETWYDLADLADKNTQRQRFNNKKIGQVKHCKLTKDK